jgi:transposase
MRKHFRHGRARSCNQFVVRSDKFNTEIVDGKLVITIRIAAKYGENITLITTTNGDGVRLDSRNLRIVLREGFTEIHYAFDKGPGRVSGTEVVGVDKGYSEALVDSDGHFHGRKFGAILRDYTDKVHITGKARGKLQVIANKHREAGRIAKADRIVRNNLGKKKQQRRRMLAQKRLRTEAFKAAHAVVDKASVVGAEDLTSVISRTKSWGRGFNRRMGFWAKGVVAEALESVTLQRSASLVLVNPAYTSQVSSLTRRLEGCRKGDRFIAACGKVVHADVNSARNVRDRIDDSEITRFMSHRDVKAILLRRSSGGALPVMRSELQVRQPGADIILCAEMSRF